MVILLILAASLMTISVVFGGIVGPIWGIIQCAISDRSGGSKAGWILALFFLGPIGVLFFAFSGASRWFRILCAWPMLLTIFLFAVVLGVDSEFRNEAIKRYKIESQK
jgi:hypothetical protein